MVLAFFASRCYQNQLICRIFSDFESPLLLQAPSNACQISIPGISGDPSINLLASVTRHGNVLCHQLKFRVLSISSTYPFNKIFISPLKKKRSLFLVLPLLITIVKRLKYYFTKKTKLKVQIITYPPLIWPKFKLFTCCFKSEVQQANDSIWFWVTVLLFESPCASAKIWTSIVHHHCYTQIKNKRIFFSALGATTNTLLKKKYKSRKKNK